jgi:hypothetical protein
MARRYYVTGLRSVLQAAHKYGTRWQSQLEESLTEEQFACLQDTLNAILSCIVLLGNRPVE